MCQIPALAPDVAVDYFLQCLDDVRSKLVLFTETPLSRREQALYSRLRSDTNFVTKKDILVHHVHGIPGRTPKRVASFAAHLRHAFEHSANITEISVRVELAAWTGIFREEDKRLKAEEQVRIASCEAGDTDVLIRIQDLIATRNSKHGQFLDEQEGKVHFPNYEVHGYRRPGQRHLWLPLW